MPIVGNRQSTKMGQSYAKDPMSTFAESFKNVAQDILNESGIDIYMEPQKAVMYSASNDTLKTFFCENSIDRNEVTSAEEYEEHMEAMKEQYLNDRQAILEYAPTGSFNPVIGMTFPMHKNILMNNVFDKGAIPKFVAREPKFTVTMETRILIAKDGTEIDMYKEQHKMMDAIDQAAPFTKLEMTLPYKADDNITVGSNTKVGVVTALNGSSTDNVSIESYISDVQVSVYLATGDTNPETGEAATEDGAVDVWVPVKLRFVPAYGEYDRNIMEKVVIKAKHPTESGNPVTELTDVIMGYMKDNKFFISSSTGVVKKVKLNARLDTSNASTGACSVSWKARTDIMEIPSAMPINTPVSPDEVKDIGALYQVNQLTKIMSLFKLALGNYKDDKIKSKLDESFVTMPKENKLQATFDFAPTDNYALDPVEWRSKMFMDNLDSYVTNMLQVLNDPNMTITVFGRPDIIRKITPGEYTYQTPSAIGPVEIDFVKTVVTADKRVYQFIGTDKMRGNNNLMIILCPRNTDRFVYRIYDYQMYVSNEIRNVANPALPAIHAFERWLFAEYQPVQGRVKILHPMGSKTATKNDDPIGTFSYSSFDANFEGVTMG